MTITPTAVTGGSLPPNTLRIYNEFIEMPGMRLTLPQAERLWGLNHAESEEALAYLVSAGFLCQSASGEYCRLSDGRFALPLRMAKAELIASSPKQLRA